MSRIPFALAGLAVAASLAACGGGSSGSTGVTPPPGAAATPSPASTTPPPVTTQQVVTLALPSSAIGVVDDPTFGTVAGFTQTVFSQVLGFAPGSQIMVRNGQSSVPHTFNVVSTTGFTNAALSTSASGGSAVGGGFASGVIAPGALAGPFTLAGGTYWLGCAFHYASNGMRTVLVVAAGATPGPQATAVPGVPAPAPGQPGY